MKTSKTVQADDGTYYPDVMTLQSSNFTLTNVPYEHPLTSNDILRVDILIGSFYGYSDYYDLVLDINEVEHIKNKNIGDVIYLPSLEELDSFYLRTQA
jgi:hypothetical protein